jgi:hypothetical protein
MSRWMYYERIEALSDPRSRTACSALVPVFSESEIHQLDHTSHNGIHKSA